jgi:phospholipid/cholesterol/gamma-HCH transport system ATP-binding protein
VHDADHSHGVRHRLSHAKTGRDDSRAGDERAEFRGGVRNPAGGCGGQCCGTSGERLENESIPSGAGDHQTADGRLPSLAPPIDLVAQAVSPAVVFDRVSFAFDDHVVLRDVSFSIPAAGMRILLGPSGAGKSVILKLILGLLRPDSGTIHVDGQRIDSMSERDLMAVRPGIGMLFQESALFDSLTVAENVGYRLYEETDMPEELVRRRIEEVLGFIGLEGYIDRMPSELSGGQRRRVAIARAIAPKPQLLLFDDPTSGLDPITAATVDDEIVKLRDVEGVTSIVATHQIRDAYYVASHEAISTNERLKTMPLEEPSRATFMVLHDARIYFEGNGDELRASRDPYLQEFLFMTLPPW